jgi:hypothetical protein
MTGHAGHVDRTRQFSVRSLPRATQRSPRHVIQIRMLLPLCARIGQRPDTPLHSTGRRTPERPNSSSKDPERVFLDRTREVTRDQTRLGVRSVQASRRAVTSAYVNDDRVKPPSL